MPYSYSYDEAKKIILVMQAGAANRYKEALDWMLYVRTDPRVGGGYGILCDLREGNLQLSPAEAFTCGTLLGRFFHGQKIAFVIPDALKPMLEKQVLAVRAAAEVQGFSDARDAERWLGAASG